MKHIPKWFDDAMSRPKKDAADANPGNARLEETDLGVDLPKDLQEFLTEAPMPDINSDESEANVPDIKIVDPDAPSGDKLTGFDPSIRSRYTRSSQRIAAISS